MSTCRLNAAMGAQVEVRAESSFAIEVGNRDGKGSAATAESAAGRCTLGR